MIQLKQYLKHLNEKSRLERDLVLNIDYVRYNEYDTIAEAHKQMKTIHSLISNAAEFNDKTTTKRIPIERFENLALMLEQNIDEEYFLSNTPVR
ncbi:MAG: hypothetical protein ABIC91_01010 [Nanoarchaeota archaeon]|nr:hypothetical protein [Nanoarchaeota archaeon]MBU1030925.1 hypothetical protein [Nanoarchaeota archaeon]MBU1850466.1 hypothetical protein [Nanoarchaeota archaeon]